jgi:predicted acylesterase/phospholipase RssA
MRRGVGPVPKEDAPLNYDGGCSGGGGTVERDIGLALSGGGSRAAAFHLGCLRALNDRGLLPRMRVISGVSGGALLAALYAYGPASFEEFDTMATELLRQGLELPMIRRFLTSPRAIQAMLSIASLPVSGVAAVLHRLPASSECALPTMTPSQRTPTRLRRVNRTTVLIDVLERQVFGNRKMHEVSHPGLDIVLTACDLGTGGAVRFGSRASACSRVGTILDKVQVASAVAASAAFPALLPALEQRYHFRDQSGNESEQILLLTDGGVYDNLGLSVLDVDRDERFTPHVYNVAYIVACDAGAGQLAPAVPHMWPKRMERVVKIMHGRAQHGERGRLYAAASSGKLSGFVYAYLGMHDDRLPIPIADLVPRATVASYPTNFRAMTREDLNALSTRGEQLVRALLPHYCSALC